MEPRVGGPRYVPFDGTPHTISLGLRPLGANAWLEPDTRRDEELAVKAGLLRTRHADVVATIPEGDAAADETFELVSGEVVGAGLMTADEVARASAGLHPIDAAGRLVQEDLCAMVDVDGHWILGAASVCFPSRWRLADKIGQDLSAIHAPVPDYPSIASSTERFFDRISVDRPVWRTNWTLIDDGALFQPGPRDPARPPVIEAEDVVLRVERQTLRRLPRTGAVLFTIRTYVDRLATLPPRAREDLRGTLAEVGEDLVEYREWRELLPVVRRWLGGA